MDAQTNNASSSTKKGDVKIVNLKDRELTASFYLGDGGQSKESLEKCIKSVLKITDPLSSVVGLMDEHGVLIPLELLESTNSIVDSSQYYSPHFWVPQISDGEGASREIIQHLANSQNASQTTATAPAQDQPAWQYPAQETTETDFSDIDKQYGQIVQPSTVPAQKTTIQYDANDPWQNWEYFHQYGKLTIHNEMLKDEARTATYREGIMKNAIDFKDKVVMDLGTGTGILSFFCVQAGAKKVYAIEASDLADWTELIVASNGLSEKITVLKGRIEDLHLPEQVDIIISEWMGTFLIFESMMESLLFARDRWLKPEGLMYPSHANIFMSPVSMDDFYKEKVEFWNDVWGVDMSIVAPFAKKCAFEKPMIDKAVKPECVLADPVTLKTFNLRDVPIDKPYEKTIVQFSFKAKRDANLHGFCAWFDVLFLGTAKENIVLSTSPDHKDTHWHQDLFLFDNPVAVKEGNTIRGTIRYQRNPDLLRHLIIDIAYVINELPAERYSKRFYLWGNE
eukprot:TRINITY_DN3648_c0_g1_i1.p1 TRINITY_DN3648_c0_g1~~TRINITY_DN3648_c0_g1_i1.p1  ORF type:complete len:509 (-),score=155.67 TRINITY_DN3648_c0_g1_i1:14-1540(-)